MYLTIALKYESMNINIYVTYIYISMSFYVVCVHGYIVAGLVTYVGLVLYDY